MLRPLFNVWFYSYRLVKNSDSVTVIPYLNCSKYFETDRVIS
jgi:hypothetical protein